MKKTMFSRKPSPVNADKRPRTKKALGQNFLRKQSVVDNMINKVAITPETSVMEIGCGDGFLTSAILAQTKCKKLWCFEIDPEWADFVRAKISDKRLSVKLKNILEVNLQEELVEHKPWVLLANLPYQITFPILFLIQKNKDLFSEGVVMVQEEVAQKICAKRGKGYSPTTLFLQHHFTWELMEKVEPTAFEPAPKVYSRLLYFKPKLAVQEIPKEEEFWQFLKLCYRSPRQTLRNNLKTTHYLSAQAFTSDLLNLRAQQLTFEDLLSIWKQVSGS